MKNPFKKFTCPHLSQDLIFIRNIHGDEINQLNARSIWLCKKCHKLIYQNQLFDVSQYSDGYHTFDELYCHRAILTSVICHNYLDRSWKSKLHHDGTMHDGMFIVGIDTPTGTATYHYDMEYWDIFKEVKELPNAPEWDGHDATAAIHRISTLKDIPKEEPKVKVVYKTVEKKPKKKVLGIF